jgi:hypothetical protein
MLTEPALHHNVLVYLNSVLCKFLQKHFLTYVLWKFCTHVNVLKLLYHLWHII